MIVTLQPNHCADVVASSFSCTNNLYPEQNLPKPRGTSMVNEVTMLESRFKEALTSGDQARLYQIHVRAMALVSRRKHPPVISANKKAYEQLILGYICHVASNDARLPYSVWWRAYYGEQKPPKKPQHSTERSRSHLREMRKHSEFTSRLCSKYKIFA